ncbi:MAG: hypothetical protein RRA63_08620 [Candidatus Calescibacterium sp.]|jgi:hypothetical protein|nr:hypothetical protein [Candidatus Calescibacterium sp.]
MRIERNKDKKNKIISLFSFFSLIVFPFLFTFFFFSCSKKVQFPTPPECLGASKRLEELFYVLKTHDIRDVGTKDVIREFFEDEESLELFIAKMIYAVRQKEVYYANIQQFQISYIGNEKKVNSEDTNEDNNGDDNESKNNGNECAFVVDFVVRKKYPIGHVQVKVDITLYKKGDFWFVKKPEIVGEVKERKEFLPSPYYY